jgi:prevent-host-death family protein
MGKIPEIVPISDMRQNAARVLKEVRSTGGPLVITQRGRASAVVISIEDYERSERERRILLELARGEKEIAKGVGHGLDAVLKEADEILRKP